MFLIVNIVTFVAWKHRFKKSKNRCNECDKSNYNNRLLRIVNCY